MAVKQAQSGVEQAESGLATIDQSTPSWMDEKAAKAAIVPPRRSTTTPRTRTTSRRACPGPRRRRRALRSRGANVKQARAGVLSAKAALVKVRRGRKTSTSSAVRPTPQSTAAEAALDVAKANLDNATLIAPMDGTVFLNPVGVAGSDGKAPLPAAGAACRSSRRPRSPWCAWARPRSPPRWMKPTSIASSWA